MTMEAGERDEQQRETWRRAAEGWERRQQALRQKSAPVSEWLVNAIDPKPGERVLELAAGPGETGFMVAQRLGPEGRLLCTDQAPEMLEVARRRASELGLTNVDFAVVDAQQLELEHEQFDAAVCRWGYMLMADPDEAMRRTRAALRDGGRLALATWDRPDRNLWLAAPVLALVGQGAMPPPNPADPSPFALPEPTDLERRLDSAGFSDARAERVEFVQQYPSFDEYWAETMDMAAPVAEALAAVSPTKAEAARASTQETLSQFAADDGQLRVPAVAVVATAVA
jgi:ubiquinone/menaquinone biosynthesis C-methylase UbiE